MKHIYNTGNDTHCSISQEILAIGKMGLWQLHSTADKQTLLLGAGFREVLGLSEALSSIDWSEYLEKFCHEDDRDKVSQVIASTLKACGSDFVCEYRTWNATTSSWCWICLFGKSECSQDGDTFISGMAQDIQEQVARSKKLEQEQKEALQTISLQNSVLEMQIKEQMALLRDAQRRIEDIVDEEPGDNIQTPEGVEPDKDSGEEQDPFELSMLLSQGLHKAVDVITKKMTWYKAVIDSIPFPVSVTDLDNHWMYLNKPALEAVGAASLTEVIGKLSTEWEAKIYGDNKCYEELVKEGHKSFKLTHPFMHRVFQGQTSDLCDDRGNSIGHIETMQDVTEIHEADERVRIMLDATPLGCVFWSPDLKKIDCNQAMVKLFDLSSKEEYLENAVQLMPERQPDGRLSITATMDWLRETFEHGFRRFEWLYKTMKGELIPAEVTLVRVQWRDNYIVAGYIRDLRELKAAEAELDKERVLLKQVLESSPVCFAILVDGVIRFVTPVTLQFLGMKVGEDISRYYADEFDVEQLMREVSEGNSLRWRPLRIRTHDGEVKDMLVNVFYADYYNERAIMIWFMDVTEIKNKERQLRQARDAAEESTRTKSAFLANMSHEVRTPMNAVLGMIHLILNTELTLKQRDYMEKAANSAKALLRIINDILDFSKIEAGKLDMEIVSFSLEHVMRGIYNVIIDKANEKNLDFYLSIAPGIPDNLRGDPLRLHQILLNLAGNAIKFTKHGSVTMGVEVRQNCDSEVVLSFYVRDSGIGMSNEEISKLFSPFSQADASTTRKYGGTGLGLAISKRLVEMMDGQIWCESSSGKGTVFYFTAKLGIAGHSPTLEGFRNLRVMLVGDKEVSRAMLKDMLQSFGCVVRMSDSLDNSLDVCASAEQHGPFDLVLMDWQNPENEGMEALHMLRDCYGAATPVILMTSPPNHYDVIECLHKAGISNVLEKPVTPSSLFDGINTALNVDQGMAALVGGLGDGTNSEGDQSSSNFSALNGAHILLAEDNEINQMVAQELLEHVGISVDIANNGLEAIELLEKGKYDLVLMDIQMPELDGLSATSQIRKNAKYNKLPILAMTAHAMSGDKEKSLEAGMNDHVTKPIDAMELYATLERWLKKSRGA